jgi:uncharacterized protein
MSPFWGGAFQEPPVYVRAEREDALRDRESREDVEWTSGAARIAGTLHVPDGDGRVPAVIIAPGSGSITRSHPMLASHAERLPKLGVAVLTFDKRGAGQSSGNWREQSLADYATDLDGALALLENHPRIDPARIGLIGHSQGGWTAPIAADRNRGVAFLVLLAATPLTPLEQGLYAEEADLSRKAVSADHRAEALALLRRIYDTYASNSGWDTTQAAIEAAKTRPWFEPGRFALQPNDSWNWKWLNRLPFDFDVAPILARLSLPILTINGALDRLVPAEISCQRFGVLRQPPALPLDSVVLADLHHSLSTAERGLPDERYWIVLAAWMRKLRIIPPAGL